jgi:phosphohistidine swiveling domain-containing protein
MNEGLEKPIRTNYIFHLSSQNLPDTIGNKAANLRKLKDKNFRIPDTYVCTWCAYLAYLESGNNVLGQIRDEISQYIHPQRFYAIRSSANLEDELNHSFAGQFSTMLDVQGIENILRAIQEIWDNTCSKAVETYLNKSIYTQQDLKMAVVIQEMIQPFASGVVFSKNPITSLDEVLVEAVLGKGTSLVQEGITPLRWINKWGGWTQTPENSPIPLALIQEVVQVTKRIVKVFKKEVDLEWVHDGQQLYWLQLRDITSLNKDNIYSNKMAKEMSPGQIKPLVWSVSIPIMPQTVVHLISEICGDIDIQADRLVKSFHYRAYYNMGVVGDLLERLGLPRESFEMMLGILPPGAGRPPMKPNIHMLRYTPRMLRFLLDKWTFSNKFEENFPRLYEQIHQFPLQLPDGLSEFQLMEMIDLVMVINREITYYTFVTPLLMSMYVSMLRSRLKKQGVDIQRFDLTEGMQELGQFDPVKRLKALNQQFLTLDANARTVIEQGDYLAFQNLDGIEPFQKQVSEFLELFGHLSDTTTNFSTTPWREMPGLILQLIASPQKSEETDSRIRFGDLPKKNWSLRLFYQRSRQFRLYREKSSSLYTYSLMTARVYYLTLADRLVQKGYLRNREEIFYLDNHEIREYISGEMPGDSLADIACQRKADMERCQHAIMPEVIFGEEIPLIIATHTRRLTGIPSSKGYYTGAIRIVRSIQDFHKLNPGDVLVIPYSDASWTPLFANAGAVIADSGGILSHSSIIAREYNIPAVVSVSGILQMEDGIIVTVDGFKGDILIHGNDRVEQINRISQKGCVEMGNN